jgi:hypothetical protein
MHSVLADRGDHLDHQEDLQGQLVPALHQLPAVQRCLVDLAVRKYPEDLPGLLDQEVLGDLSVLVFPVLPADLVAQMSLANLATHVPLKLLAHQGSDTR